MELDKYGEDKLNSGTNAVNLETGHEAENSQLCVSQRNIAANEERSMNMKLENVVG